MKKLHEKTEHLKPIITEKKIWNMQYFIFALIIGIIIVASIITILFLFELTMISAIAMVAIFIAFYSIFLFFLIEPQILREIQKQQIITQTYEKPVMKEVIKEVIKEIEKPVIKEVIREIKMPTKQQPPIIKTLMVEAPRKKLNIPKYNFFGSTQTKTYHKSSCRLRKLIKRKYKESANTERFFLSRDYTPCKICLKAKKQKTKISPKTIKRNIPKGVTSIAKRAAEIRNKLQQKQKEEQMTKTLNKIKKLSEDTNKKTSQTQNQMKKVASKIDKVEETVSEK